MHSYKNLGVRTTTNYKKEHGAEKNSKKRSREQQKKCRDMRKKLKMNKEHR